MLPPSRGETPVPSQMPIAAVGWSPGTHSRGGSSLEVDPPGAEASVTSSPAPRISGTPLPRVDAPSKGAGGDGTPEEGADADAAFLVAAESLEDADVAGDVVDTDWAKELLPDGPPPPPPDAQPGIEVLAPFAGGADERADPGFGDVVDTDWAKEFLPDGPPPPPGDAPAEATGIAEGFTDAFGWGAESASGVPVDTGSEPQSSGPDVRTAADDTNLSVESLEASQGASADAEALSSSDDAASDRAPEPALGAADAESEPRASEAVTKGTTGASGDHELPDPEAAQETAASHPPGGSRDGAEPSAGPVTGDGALHGLFPETASEGLDLPESLPPDSEEASQQAQRTEVNPDPEGASTASARHTEAEAHDPSETVDTDWAEELLPDGPPPPPKTEDPAGRPDALRALAEGSSEQRFGFSAEELAILDALERLASGSDEEANAAKVRPARMIASVVRLLLRKGLIDERELLDELSRG